MDGNVIYPAQYHARTSATSRAAKRLRRASVTPAPLAFSVDKTAGHHFEGMASRRHHLMTAQFPAPTSDAMASREDQSSMTDRNEVSCESEATMPELLGHIVPNSKAIMVRDLDLAVGHSVPMVENSEKIAASAWQKAFQERLSRIQGKLTHKKMADYLGMDEESWKKCVNRGSAFPIRKLPKLALLGRIEVEDLITGEKDHELPPLIKRYSKRMAAAKRRAV